MVERESGLVDPEVAMPGGAGPHLIDGCHVPLGREPGSISRPEAIRDE
jgi:hypothetical protein